MKTTASLVLLFFFFVAASALASGNNNVEQEVSKKADNESNAADDHNNNNNNNNQWAISNEPPFLSTMLDGFFLSSEPLISSILDDMAEMQQQFFFGNWPTITTHDNWDDEKENRMVPTTHHPLLRGQSSMLGFPATTLQQFGMVNDNEKFQISFKLPPGMTSKNVNVELLDGGSKLVIHGQTTTSTTTKNDKDETTTTNKGWFGGHFAAVSMSSFSQSVDLDQSVQVDQLVATIKDGTLTVSAPKDATQLRTLNHEIPIQDLDAAPDPVPQLPASSPKSRVSQFLSKSLPFVDNANNNRHGTQTKDVVEDKEQNVVHDASSITDAWKDIRESSL